jgi:hypothetical protein
MAALLTLGRVQPLQERAMWAAVSPGAQGAQEAQGAQATTAAMSLTPGVMRTTAATAATAATGVMGEGLATSTLILAMTERQKRGVMDL